jgi:glycosyltransferase involved in cell wall biosynthesis
VRRPVVVLPTGVDLDSFRPGDQQAARRALALPPAGPLCLYLGRIDREKNLEFLLDAFARVAAERPAARLVLVGRGTREARLRRHAERVGLGDRVHFAGGVAPDVAPLYYQAADVFLFASTTETQGLAVLEAMAAGRPVVAVRASGVEETVVDGVTGLLVPEDLDVFAAAVLQVLADGGLAAKLSAGGREAALGFGARALGARLAALYRTVRAGRVAA